MSRGVEAKRGQMEGAKTIVTEFVGIVLGDGKRPAKVVFDTLSEAALGLGLSVKALQRLGERGSSIVITVINGQVEMELKPPGIEDSRDLWEETLATLERGRSEHGRLLDLYKCLFLTSKLVRGGEAEIAASLPSPRELPDLGEEGQRLAQILEAGRTKDGLLAFDLQTLEAIALTTFCFLGRGTQEELKGQGMSPGVLLVQPDR